MAALAEHRATVESFVESMHRGADPDALRCLLAEGVSITGPLSDEPLSGRDAVIGAIRDIAEVATDLTYKEVLSGETHHAALFRLQIDDTAVDGMDYIRVDADGRIADITIFWRPLPSASQLQARLGTNPPDQEASTPS